MYDPACTENISHSYVSTHKERPKEKCKGHKIYVDNTGGVIYLTTIPETLDNSALRQIFILNKRLHGECTHTL